MYSASRAYHSALAQVVLPTYIMAPTKIHAELFTDTCDCVLGWLSLY